MVSKARLPGDLQCFDPNAVAELWDKRRGSQLLHAVKPTDAMTSPNSSQDKPPGEPGPGSAAPTGTGLLHQYLWETEGHPMLSPQPAADQTYVARPVRTCSTMTANTVPPSNASGPSYQTVGSVGTVGSGESATGIFGPVSPVSNGGKHQSPLRNISSTPSSIRSPSNQASLQGPGLWTEPPSESTYFLPRSPPRSNSNYSRTEGP